MNNVVEQALRDQLSLFKYFPTCNLIYRTPREKVLADGVLQGIQESTLADLFHYYEQPENCDIYILCGTQASTWEAVKLLQDAYGRTGRAYFVPNYFKELHNKPRNTLASNPSCNPASADSSWPTSPILLGSMTGVPLELNGFGLFHNSNLSTSTGTSTTTVSHRHSIHTDRNIEDMISAITKLRMFNEIASSTDDSCINSRNPRKSHLPPVSSPSEFHTNGLNTSDRMENPGHVENRRIPSTKSNKKCQLYRQSTPAYLRHMVDSSRFYQDYEIDGKPILDSLPMPHITNHNDKAVLNEECNQQSYSAGVELHALTTSPNVSLNPVVLSRRQYTILDVLARYRCQPSREMPREWEYLTTLDSTIFHTNCVLQRVKHYLDFWNMEEY